MATNLPDESLNEYGVGGVAPDDFRGDGLNLDQYVREGKGGQVYNLITREREFIDSHKLRLPSEAIQTNKPLQNLVNNFIFGKKLPKEVEHNGLRIHDMVHYKHSHELFEIVRFVD